MRTRLIEQGRARVIIAEHRDSCYLAVGVDSAALGTFLTADQAAQMAVELAIIAARIRERAERLPTASNPS